VRKKKKKKKTERGRKAEITEKKKLTAGRGVGDRTFSLREKKVVPETAGRGR